MEEAIIKEQEFQFHQICGGCLRNPRKFIFHQRKKEKTEMKQKSRLFIIANLLMALLILMGCAAQPTPAVPLPPLSLNSPTDAAAPSAAPVKVQYWSNGWFAQSIDARKAVVDKFNQEYKGKIEVEYIQGDWDNGEQYIQNGAAAGGGIACLMEWYDAGAADWYRKGYVNDLRPYITPEIKALMPEASWKARTFEDGAIVMNGTVMGDLLLTLMYNPRVLQSCRNRAGHRG